MAKAARSNKKSANSRKKPLHLSFKNKLQLRLGRFFYPTFGLAFAIVMGGRDCIFTNRMTRVQVI